MACGVHDKFHDLFIRSELLLLRRQWEFTSMGRPVIPTSQLFELAKWRVRDDSVPPAGDGWRIKRACDKFGIV